MSNSKYVVWYCPNCKRDFIRELRNSNKSAVRFRCILCTNTRSFKDTTIHGIYDNPHMAKQDMIKFNFSQSNLPLTQQQILYELGENFTYYEAQNIERFKKIPKISKVKQFKNALEEYISLYGSYEIEVEEFRKFSAERDIVDFDKMMDILSKEGSLIQKTDFVVRYFP